MATSQTPYHECKSFTEVYKQDVDSGTWGFLANVRLRETRRLTTGHQYAFFSKKASGERQSQLSLIMALSDGMRRQIQTPYNSDTDSPESIAYELVQEGLLCEKDRLRMREKIESEYNRGNISKN
ncbi:hypothetical protein SARC_02280 [Sphaeroforma arctica JP610]|uniref:non-specific serine/threonine protein kinase n=1 Tax=Sphaeroforma arctica JP610 TaxID=667725 RepID=A0A0L0GBD2_9EUKA|nr:hypothetical protein SARC_02280 [Sphaeroforma arctica JP610]KNC85558.1 hypothetical protein SARC_02280 [Sphaeroforma arctica JP610]|eukprot:XP_014159460.1 hypothetical protein SARC_02280 [Sphaeroforma arctica JP610]